MFKLHVTANYETGDDEEYKYKGAYEADDLLGIIKTYMEYADNASSYVFTVVKERSDAQEERETEERRLKEMDQWESEHRVEGTQANFDRYIAGDR
jgi:hypothetical protein